MIKLAMPLQAQTILRALRDSGFDAYVVGGCVRDALLGLTPHDWDICTDAKPRDLQRVFRDCETFDFGLKHGTLTVLADGVPYEVTTYRVDGVYADNRHPEQVTFTDDLTLDLSRRDFTCNAIAYNEAKGLIDPFDGAQDIRNHLLRCVGDPDTRFNEDALRILRALRFAAVYGFTFETETSAAIHRNAALLNHIAAERIRCELSGILTGKYAADILTAYRDVFAVFLPEIQDTFDFPQHTRHHRYDVWTHIVHSVAEAPQDELLRTVMLLHDVGKPLARTTDAAGTDHFKGHPQHSAALAQTALQRLKAPRQFTEDCTALILHHDVRFTGAKKQVKRVLQALGEENLRRLLAVQRADIAAQSDYRRAEKLASVATAGAQLEEILAQNECVSVKDLAVNGNDLMALGAQGRAIGNLLNALLEEVVDETLPNEKTALLNRAGEILGHGNGY